MSKKLSLIARLAGVSAVVGALLTTGVAYATVPTLSQTSVTVGIGQSTSITATNGVSVYMELNSSPTIASVSISGTQVTVTGMAPGSATITLCAVGTSSDCTNLYATVQTGTVSGISFSANNLSLSISGSQSVTVSGGNGTYSISSNSNTSVASTNLSGTLLTVTGLANGGATIKVCDSTGNTCGTLTVTISSSGSSSTSTLSFSQNNISLVTGGSQVVSITGGNNVYAISSDSNSSVVSAGMANNAVTVYALSAGSVAIKVCDTSGNVCGIISVTATAPTTSSNQAVTFSNTNPTVAAGQNVNITLSATGATGYVVLSNQNASIAQATVSGTALTLYGIGSGTDLVTICAIGGGCSPLTATVSGSVSTTPTPTPSPTPTTTPTPTPTPTPVTGTVVANATLVAEIQALQAVVTQTMAQLQSIQSQLNQIQAQVNAGAGASAGTSGGTVSGAFTETLTTGSQDAQVTALQQRLALLGFYSGPVTGYYGSLTAAAVIKYQTAHGIEATGSVGPSTRVALNAGN